jgi:hypothetical protein
MLPAACSVQSASIATPEYNGSEKLNSTSLLELRGLADEWPLLSDNFSRREQPVRVSEEDGEFMDIATLKKELDAIPSSVGILPIIFDDSSRHRSASEPAKPIQRTNRGKSVQRKQSAAARIETASPFDATSVDQSQSNSRQLKQTKSADANLLTEKPLPDLPPCHKRGPSSISKNLSSISESSGEFHVNATDALDPKPTKSRERWPKTKRQKEFSNGNPDLLGSYFEHDEGPHPGQKVALPKKRSKILICIWKRIFGTRSSN